MGNIHLAILDTKSYKIDSNTKQIINENDEKITINDEDILDLQGKELQINTGSEIDVENTNDVLNLKKNYKGLSNNNVSFSFSFQKNINESASNENDLVSKQLLNKIKLEEISLKNVSENSNPKLFALFYAPDKEEVDENNKYKGRDFNGLDNISDFKQTKNFYLDGMFSTNKSYFRGAYLNFSKNNVNSNNTSYFNFLDFDFKPYCIVFVITNVSTIMNTQTSIEYSVSGFLEFATNLGDLL